MERLIINGQDVGAVKARRYNRVERIDGMTNDWYFLMQGGYFIKIEGHNIKQWTTAGDGDITRLDVLTYE